MLECHACVHDNSTHVLSFLQHVHCMQVMKGCACMCFGKIQLRFVSFWLKNMSLPHYLTNNDLFVCFVWPTHLLISSATWIWESPLGSDRAGCGNWDEMATSMWLIIRLERAVQYLHTFTPFLWALMRCKYSWPRPINCVVWFRKEPRWDVSERKLRPSVKVHSCHCITFMPLFKVLFPAHVPQN